MKSKLRAFIRKQKNTALAPFLHFLSETIVSMEMVFFRVKWFLQGKRKPNQEEVELICKNVTFIYKSFERQSKAKRLYKNIQSYYPGVKVIIADDSAKPLEIKGENVEIIQLPFNSGLSMGLNRALERVATPFTIRMDDDELLTPFTGFHDELKFLMEHPEVDLVGVLPFNLPMCTSLKEVERECLKHSMDRAPKKLRIPHLTRIDDSHIVLGKVINIFIARTDKFREVGYDDNIRMIDHHEFFYRAAGNLVSVLNQKAFVFHYHNQFDAHYDKYRSDFLGDKRYIRWKMMVQAEQRAKGESL